MTAPSWELRDARIETLAQYCERRRAEDEVAARNARLSAIRRAWDAAPAWLKGVLLIAHAYNQSRRR